MPLSKEFRKTVTARLGQDPDFADALLREGLQALIDGDVPTGRAVLRDYINGTVGFDALSKATGIGAKSLMRMFSQSGNPQANKLFPVLATLQELTGRHVEVRAA